MVIETKRRMKINGTNELKKVWISHELGGILKTRFIQHVYQTSPDGKDGKSGLLRPIWRRVA